MKSFEELKQKLFSRADNTGLFPEDDIMGLLEIKTKAELLKVITADWSWEPIICGFIDAYFLEDNFTEDELTDANIFTKGEHEVKTASFVCGDAEVEAHDNAIVYANGRATVYVFDNATVKAHNEVRMNAFDNATVEAYDSTRVEAHDNAMVTADRSATVTAFDNAKVDAYGNVEVKAYDNSFVDDWTGNVRPQSDHAIVRDRKNNRIYVKKGKFEIVEVD